MICFSCRQRGFTLMEMVLTLTVLAIIAGAGARIIGAAFNAWMEARAIAPLATRGQLAMERMIRELRVGSCATLTQPEGPITIQVQNSLGEVLFRHGQSPVDGIYRREDGGGDKLLLAGVAAADVNFSISTSRRCLVTIQFVLTDTFVDGGSLRYPLRTAIHVRKP